MLLPTGRLHLQHGPIDLIIGVDDDTAPRRAAFGAASTRFATLLDQLCAELPALRAAAGAAVLHGPVARRMDAAVRPYAESCFITPMAAVAGAVADEIIAAMRAATPLRRAFVNNGGDIALHLADGECFRIGLIDRPDRPGLFGTTEVTHADPVRGVATSGWRGRSLSRGIADAVTVLAACAADADAAATIIANAVDLPGHPAIRRLPACDVQADSDLGDRLVTSDVGALSPDAADAALRHGARVAAHLLDTGLIAAAALHCQGRTCTVGTIARPQPLERTRIHA